MNAQDRAFLQDSISLNYMNRLTTVFILYEALVQGESELESIALFCDQCYRSSDPDDARIAGIKARGDAVRVKHIICAKIYQEFMASIEDIGALGSAIQNRFNDGIFARYLNSQTGEVGRFFDMILAADVPNHPNVTIESLLHLPSVASISSQLPSEKVPEFQESYRNQATNLYNIAKIYRGDTKPMTIHAASDDISPLSPSPEDINILLSVTPSGEPLSQQSAMVRAFNKIKHRFMLTERLNDYVDPLASDQVEYGRFSFDAVHHYKDQLIGIVGTMIELVAIVQTLDSLGITL